MAADTQPLNIDVVTRYDGSGLQQLRADAQAINKDIADQLSQAGAYFDPVSSSFKSVAKDAQDTNEAMLLTGASINKARGEATVLARELATGSVQARTLGALLGALGTPITIAAIAGIGLFRIIEQIAESTLKAAEAQVKNQLELEKAVKQWVEIAKFAQTLGDEVKLADAIDRELDKSALDMAKFRAEQLGFWQSFWDSISHFLTIPGVSSPFTFAGQQQQQMAAAQEEYNQKVRDAVAATLAAKQNTEDWQHSQDHLAEGITLYTNKVNESQAKVDELAQQMRETSDPKLLDALLRQYDEANRELKNAQSSLEKLTQQQEELNRAAAQENRKNILEVLREEETILQSIRQQQQLTNANPFMSADDKSAALAGLYVQEMERLQSIMAAINAEKAKGPLDPAQVEQLNQKWQQADFELKLIQEKLLSLGHPVMAELVSWANSFGTSWQQVGKSISESVNTALSDLNNYLVTGKFNAQTLLQHLALIGLQLLEHIAIQQVMHAISQAFMAENQAQGVATASAWAPAAASSSIATSGTSAVVGEAAALAAIFAIMGALVAHEGGAISRKRVRRFHDGGLADDEVPIIAQEGEVIIQRDVAQQPGMMDYLLGLNAGMFHRGGAIRRMHDGGAVLYNSRGLIVGVYDDQGNLIEGATPSWYSSPGAQGPPDQPWSGSSDPSIEPTPIPDSGPDYFGNGPSVQTGDFPDTPSSYYPSVPPGYYYPGIPDFPDVGPLWNQGSVGASGPGSRDYGYGGYDPGDYGFTPPLGTPGWLQGPTVIPTSFDSQGYPFAVPVGAGDSGPDWAGNAEGGGDYGGGSGGGFAGAGAASLGFGGIGGFGGTLFGSGSGGVGNEGRALAHRGGLIMRSMPRFHSGGGIGAGSPSSRIAGSSPRKGGRDVHIYAFTDPKAMSKHMSSREGQKIIFDTVKGRRIDLG